MNPREKALMPRVERNVRLFARYKFGATPENRALQKVTLFTLLGDTAVAIEFDNERIQSQDEKGNQKRGGDTTSRHWPGGNPIRLKMTASPLKHAKRPSGAWGML